MRPSVPLLIFASACAPPGYLGGVPLKDPGNLGRVAAAGNAEVNVDAIESAIMKEAQGTMALLARGDHQGALSQEKSLQYSGDFSDDAIASMGRQLGAMYLFVGVGNVVELPKEKREVKPVSCATKFAAGADDDAKTLRAKKRQRDDCEAQNEELYRHAELDLAAQAAKRRYKLRLRVVDVTQGVVVASADFVGDEGDFGSSCDFDCIKDKAARRAVRFLITGSGEKQAKK